MLDLTSLKSAVSSLETALKVARQSEKMSDEVRDTIRAGVIQNFEFTYELCWKFMKRWLSKNLGRAYVDGIPRQELFRLAAESLLISDVSRWINYHEARNETSHVYDKTTAGEVFDAAVDFLDDAKIFLVNLEKKND